MNIQIPPVTAIKAGLESMTHASVQELSRISGVPFTTIWKIRSGITENPGMDTVGRFWPHMESARKAVAPADKAVA